MVCLTAATAPMARLADEVADLVLVGDSLGMVIYGHKTTLSVTLQTITAHAKAVVDATFRAAVAVDMPFASYQSSPQKAYDNAAAVLARSGAQAVKLEGGKIMAETIAFLSLRGIPVVAHIGVTPQSINFLGDYRRRGAERGEKKQLLADGDAVASAGAAAVVLENIEPSLAARLTSRLPVPTIGIGSGEGCGGQIAVSEDILGFSESPPPFVKKRMEGAELARAAFTSYRDDIKSGQEK